MGLIRKSLAVGTVGVVSGSSKKQKVANATQRAAQASAETAAAAHYAAQYVAEENARTAAASWSYSGSK